MKIVFAAGLGLALLLIGLYPVAAQVPPADSYGGMDHWMTNAKGDITMAGTTGAPTKCFISAVIDFQLVISHMPDIRESWLTHDHSVDFYQINALRIIYGILSHKVGGVLMQGTYFKHEGSHPDRCHFALSLDKADQFGHVQRIPMLGWDITDAIATKIDWSTFDDRNLPQIALNYAFTPLADQLLRASQGRKENPALNAPGPEEDCNKTMKLYSYLSRAQFQCGFTDYSLLMINAAKRCFGVVGESASKADVLSGIELFDTEERARGHAAQCQAVLHDYSGLVRR